MAGTTKRAGHTRTIKKTDATGIHVKKVKVKPTTVKKPKKK
jgi:hypothetical protein